MMASAPEIGRSWSMFCKSAAAMLYAIGGVKAGAPFKKLPVIANVPAVACTLRFHVFPTLATEKVVGMMRTAEPPVKYEGASESRSLLGARVMHKPLGVAGMETGMVVAPSIPRDWSVACIVAASILKSMGGVVADPPFWSLTVIVNLPPVAVLLIVVVVVLPMAGAMGPGPASAGVPPSTMS